MNIQEYEFVKGMSYEEYCNYLDKKYSNSDKIGLFKHHTFENVKPNLSNPEFAKDATEEEKNTITYCSFDEHLFLHILIGEQTDARKALGIGGAVNYIIPQLNKYFNSCVMDYSEVYYNNLDKSVFDILVNRCNEDLSKINIALDHNQTVYLQAENYLNTKNKALVIIGTGLGKTTTALEYLWKNKCRALVIGPNNLIKNGWEEYSDWCDTTTYQAFANSYYNIDYSKYGVVILDEAHHIGYDEETEKGAKVWSEGIRYLFDNNIKVLGLTATPERSDKIDISKTFFEGCVCEGFAVEDGIENGIIHPFSYITAYYDTNGILDQYSDCENKELVGQLDLAINNTPTVKEIFKKHMPDNKRKGIVFIQEIDDESEVINIMKDVYPNVEMRIIHSKMNQGEIEDNRNWFENTDEGYLLAVNMISEGAHYKGVNTLIMFRRTNSYLVFTQQLGRIITLTKNENPNAIVFDLVNNIENVQYGNNNTELKNKHSISKIIKVLRQSESFRSNQIIVADETRDIVKCIRDIKQFENDYWEDWEIDILKENYSSNCVKDCANLINSVWGYNKRTYGSIKRQAHKLNLQLHHQHLLTEEEIEVIKQSKSVQDAANKLNLSYGSVYNISKKLDIEFDNKVTLWSDEEIKILKTCKTIEEAMIKINRPKGSILTHASSLGISLAKDGRFWTDEMIQLLKSCNSLEDAKNRFFNRSINSIKSAAKRYNIKLSTYKNPIWSPEQEEILRNCHTLKEAVEKTGFGITNVLKKLKELDFNLEPVKQVHKDRKIILCVETGEVGPATFFIEKGIISKGRLYCALRTNKPSCGYHWKYVEEESGDEKEV